MWQITPQKKRNNWYCICNKKIKKSYQLCSLEFIQESITAACFAKVWGKLCRKNMKHLPFVEFFKETLFCVSRLVKWYSAPNNHNCFLLFVVILMSITNTSGFYLSRLNCTSKASGLGKNTCYYWDCYTNTKQPLMEEIMEPAHQPPAIIPPLILSYPF